MCKILEVKFYTEQARNKAFVPISGSGAPQATRFGQGGTIPLSCA